MPKAVIIDGRKIAEETQLDLKAEVDALAKKGITPGLATVLVGEDPASQVYVRMKQKACDRLGILSRGVRLPASIGQADLISEIETLNADPEIHGILVDRKSVV